MEGAIYPCYYHDEIIIGGKNIRYYEINLGAKNF
jgi:hypothetical protein